MKQIIKYTLVVLGTISMVVLIYQFRSVVLLLVISLAFTAASRPLVDRFRRYRVPGFVAQLLILVMVFAVLSGLLFLIGPIFIEEIQRLTNNSLIQYSSVYELLESGSAWQQMMISRLPEPGRLADSILGTNGELLLPAAINLTQNLAGFITSLFIVLTFSLYLAQDQTRFIQLWLTLLPAYRRAPVRNVWQAMEKSVGGYLRHEFTLGFVAAMLLGVGFALLGLPYYIVLAVLAFMSWFVPLLGFAIILIPVTLAALGGGWWLAVLSIGYTMLIFMGLKYWIEPKYLHPRRYSSFLIVFWIVVLGSFLGIGGYLAGPVVAVASQAIWDQYLQQRSKKETDRVQLTDLKERYAVVHKQYSKISPDNNHPHFGSLLDRLERSITHVEHLEETHFSEN